MARNTKDEAERRVNLGRPLTRFNLSGLSYKFVKAALGEGKRVVIEYDGAGRGFELTDGTNDGFEIRHGSQADRVVGTAKFSELSKVANANQISIQDMADHFANVAADPVKNAVAITFRGGATGLVLAKANDLDAIKMKP